MGFGWVTDAQCMRDGRQGRLGMRRPLNTHTHVREPLLLPTPILLSVAWNFLAAYFK